MLSLFRTNQASAGLLLFFYALVLQLPVIFGWAELPIEPNNGGGFLSLSLSAWLENHFYLSVLFPVLLVTGQGIIANVLVTRYRLSRKITQFPGLFLILCWALVPAFRSFHPVQLAAFFMMLSLLALGRVYKREEPAVAIFNVGGWLGIAILFSPGYVVLLPAFIIGIGIMRRPEFRSILQLITGVLLPTFLVLAYTYYSEGLGDDLVSQFINFTWFQWAWPTVPNQLGLGILGLLAIFVIGAFSGTTQLLNIEGKKNVGVLYWVLFFLFINIGVSAGTDLAYLQIITVPIGIILGLRFIMISSSKAEFLHLLLFSAALGSAIWSIFV